MPRYTGPVNFVLDAIAKRKDKHNSRLHVKVDHHGEYYYVTHWYSVIAIGRGTDMPDMMNLHGWTSATTRNLLQALNFDLGSKVIKYGIPYRNKETGRMNHNRGSVIHVAGRPLLGADGNTPDYRAWYDKEGNFISKEDPVW